MTSACDAYRRLRDNWRALLTQINPNQVPTNANCPETADAVNDFLRTGSVRPVRQANAVTAIFAFGPGVSWTLRSIPQIEAGVANCSHVVVRGTRSYLAADREDRTHFFTVFKVDNVAWVADAFTIELARGLLPYVNAEPPNHRMNVFHVASSNYDIRVVDPLAG